MSSSSFFLDTSFLHHLSSTELMHALYGLVNDLFSLPVAVVSTLFTYLTLTTAAVALSLPIVAGAYLYQTKPTMLLDFASKVASRICGLTDRTIEVEGYTYKYSRGGNPAHPKIVLIHGFGMTKSMWSTIAGKLIKAKFDVICPDLVGHGETVPADNIDDAGYGFSAQVRRLHSFITKLVGNKAVHIGGTSMGGGISGIYAARYPSHVLSLWLLCPAGILGAKKSIFIRDVESGSGNLLLSTSPADMNVLFRHLFYAPPYIPQRLFIAWSEEKKERLRLHQQIMADLTMPNQVLLMHSVLPHIHCPTCVAWGDHDEILDVSCVDVIKKHIPHCDLQVLPNVGHAITIEGCDAITAQYIRFVSALPRNAKTVPELPDVPPPPLIALMTNNLNKKQKKLDTKLLDHLSVPSLPPAPAHIGSDEEATLTLNKVRRQFSADEAPSHVVSENAASSGDDSSSSDEFSLPDSLSSDFDLIDMKRALTSFAMRARMTGMDAASIAVMDDRPTVPHRGWSRKSFPSHLVRSVSSVG